MPRANSRSRPESSVEPLHEIEEAEGADEGARAGAVDNNGNAVDGSALLAGTGGDASTNPPWLPALYASLSQQLATSLAASEDAARARLEQQAADQLARTTAQQQQLEKRAADQLAQATALQQQLDLSLQRFAQQQAASVAQSAPGPPFPAAANADVFPQPQAQAPRDDASIAGSAASHASTAEDIDTILGTALGTPDPSLRWDPAACYCSTELWRILQTLKSDKKLDVSECHQLNTIVGAARILIHLRGRHGHLFPEDDVLGIDDILERCSRDLCRIHVRSDPLVKTKEDAERIFGAAIAKRDKETSVGALGGVPITLPEVQEILARMRRDQAEKVFVHPNERRRQDRADVDDRAKAPPPPKGSERDAAADRKRQAQKITELTKFIKAAGLEPPKKEAGAAGGRSRQKKATAADDAAAP